MKYYYYSDSYQFPSWVGELYFRVASSTERIETFYQGKWESPTNHFPTGLDTPMTLKEFLIFLDLRSLPEPIANSESEFYKYYKKRSIINELNS